MTPEKHTDKEHWILRIPKPKRLKVFLAKHADTLVMGMLFLVAVMMISTCYIVVVGFLENWGWADIVLNLTPRHLALGVAFTSGIWAIKKIIKVFEI